MRWLGRTSCTPIGLDVGGCCIKAAQLWRAPKGWRLHAAVALPRLRPGEPLDQAELARIADVLERYRFRGRDIIMAAPREAVLSAVLDLPSRASGAPLDQIARGELARLHQVGPDTFEMVMWDLPRGRRAADLTPVMVAGYPVAQAEHLLDLFQGCDLDVRGLDLASWALLRATRPTPGAGAGATVILDLGWTGARLAILDRQAVLYEREVPEAGVRAFEQALQERWEIPPPMADVALRQIDLASTDDRWAAFAGIIASQLERLTQEVELAITYVGHQYAGQGVDQVLLAGGAANIPGLAQRMSVQLGVPVQLARHAAAPPGAVHDGPALLTAIGLAQYQREDADVER